MSSMHFRGASISSFASYTLFIAATAARANLDCSSQRALRAPASFCRHIKKGTAPPIGVFRWKSGAREANR